MSNSLCLVTALFDLGRGELNSGFKRSFDHYLECFSKLLKTSLPMIIFCDAKVEEFVWKHRKPHNTKVIRKTLDDLRNFPFYQQVQKIRKSEKWLSQAGWLRESTQATLELYNPLVMSKMFLLHDSSLYGMSVKSDQNHNETHDSKYFLWLDAGIANTVNLDQYIIGKEQDFEKRITPLMNKMLYVAFPYDGMTEVHGFDKNAMNSYLGISTPNINICRGGIFGGTKETLSEINSLYYSILNDTLNAGYMGTEENIHTIISYKHKDKCNVKMIENNGLVYKFFEDLNKIKIPKNTAEELAIYSLTFNLPKQFELWCESFIKAYPKDFTKHKKYVINNSNNPAVEKEYKELFKKYGFEVIWEGDNIGINSGRVFAADHFDKSGHDMYIFSEDDMMFISDPNTRCKNGFTCYHDNLFEKCMDIVKNENLDYLKLNFTEFYGDCHDNWAWYNVPQDKKAEWFPDRKDGVSCKKTKVDYTGSHRGLPFSVGEYHYCNWMIFFTKLGNRKLFIDTRWEHTFEQTLMSHCFSLIRNGDMKVGTLLASPVKHNRVYHYDGKIRREHKHYKN